LQINLVMNDKLQGKVVTYLRNGGVVSWWIFGMVMGGLCRALSASFSSVVARHTKRMKLPPLCL